MYNVLNNQNQTKDETIIEKQPQSAPVCDKMIEKTISGPITSSPRRLTFGRIETFNYESEANVNKRPKRPSIIKPYKLPPLLFNQPLANLDNNSNTSASDPTFKPNDYYNKQLKTESRDSTDSISSNLSTTFQTNGSQTKPRYQIQRYPLRSQMKPQNNSGQDKAALLVDISEEDLIEL